MKSFEGQLLINEEFRSIRPGGRIEPYRWRTEEEARYMVESSYPDYIRLDKSKVRVIEVKFPANISYDK